MKALDTSALLRFLTEDDKEKSEKVREIIEGEGVYICGEVIIECVYVLMSKRHMYKKKKEEIIEILEDFLTLEQVYLEDNVYLEALELWKYAKKVSFPDIVISLKALREGFELFSFDTELLKWRPRADSNRRPRD